jgi:hypothetical protein
MKTIFEKVSAALTALTLGDDPTQLLREALCEMAPAVEREIALLAEIERMRLERDRMQSELEERDRRHETLRAERDEQRRKCAELASSMAFVQRRAAQREERAAQMRERWLAACPPARLVQVPVFVGPGTEIEVRRLGRERDALLDEISDLRHARREEEQTCVK